MLRWFKHLAAVSTQAFVPARDGGSDDEPDAIVQPAQGDVRDTMTRAPTPARGRPGLGGTR